MKIGHCQFEKRPDDGLWQCSQCGYIYKHPLDKPPIRNCPNAPDLRPAAERLAEETGDPTILNKIVHYGAALSRWTASGFRTRTAEEIAQIYTEHCGPCEFRDPEADACKICGCNVRIAGMPAKNLIAMATENCPRGKW